MTLPDQSDSPLLPRPTESPRERLRLLTKELDAQGGVKPSETGAWAIALALLDVADAIRESQFDDAS